MKKYIIALAAIAAIGMTACDEYTLPNPPAQSNPDETVFVNSDLKVTNLVTSTIDLPALNAAGKSAELLSVTVSNFPESYNLQFEAEFSATEKFDPEVSYTCSYSDGMVTIPVVYLQNAFNSLISKDTQAKPMYARISAYAVNGTTKVRLNEPGEYCFNGTYTIKPEAPSYVIEEAYYLVGNFCNWDIKKGIAFTHAPKGIPFTPSTIGVYDAPEFSVLVTVSNELAATVEGLQWKIVPASGYAENSWAGAYGAPDMVLDTPATLVPAPEAETEAGQLNGAGTYRINVNMETLECEVTYCNYLWVPSASTSLTDFAKMRPIASSGATEYKGALALKGDFSFAAQAAAEGTFYTVSGTPSVADNGTVSGMMDMSTSANGAMMNVANAGLYLVKANIATMEWSATPLPVISAIGGFNGWNTGTAPDLKPNADYTVWTLSNAAMTAGEFKFCVNHDWAISFGGSFDNIVENGGNLNLEEDGTYDIILHFDTLPNYVEIIKK